MEKEFVPYELALRMKQLGFDERTLRAYYKESEQLLDIGSGNMYDTKAPLFQQAFRWFREKYPDLDFAVGKIHNGTNNYHYHINLTWEFFEGTYEEAELACLDKLIEIVESKLE